MPLIKVKHVVSFISEDSSQQASNLLKAETYRKWRCADAGEKQASVILELEKATKIHSIDLGNNGSAFVEVLVGRGSWDSTEDYKVLLVTSSFMSPSESKSFTSTNRVRMFGNDKLSKPVADEKWDRIKLVCTQPFNKSEQYGLSFISLHSPPDDTKDDKKGESASSSVATPKRLGSFTLRDEEDDSFTPGSMFFKKKSPPPSMSAAAEVRAASATTSSSSEWAAMGSSMRSRQPVAKPREEKGGVRDPEMTSVKPVPVKLAKPFTPAKKATAEIPTKRKHKNSPKPDVTRTDKLSKPKAAPSHSSPPPKRKYVSSSKPKEAVPFNKLLKDVVFVLSGFKNPERGDVRDKALQLGAQYKPDWTIECTHLICAFPNTPKYNQVKGKGKIVSKKWVSDCYRKEKRLPTRNYHLPGDTSSSDESSEEEEELRRKSPPRSRDDYTPPPDPKGVMDDDPGDVAQSSSSTKRSPPISNDEKGDMDNVTRSSSSTKRYTISNDDKGDMDDDSGDNEQRGERVTADSDEDTEDELDRIQQNDKTPDDDDIYDASTDDEDGAGRAPDGAESDIPDELLELPDFLSHKHFLLYGEFDPKVRRSLVRYITAYNGVLEEYMADTVDFVITNETWDQNFEDALAENASLAFVRPTWIFECDKKGALVPFQPHIIVPDT